jgi:hypothetical protein
MNSHVRVDVRYSIKSKNRIAGSNKYVEFPNGRLEPDNTPGSMSYAILRCRS